MDNIEEKYFFTRGKVILFAFLLIVLLIVIFSIKGCGNSSTNEYKSFEEELKSAAENYFIIVDDVIEDGKEVRISLDRLKGMNLVFNELKNTCSGYVIVSSEKDISTDTYDIYYRPYIKCGNKYITPNYSEY